MKILILFFVTISFSQILVAKEKGKEKSKKTQSLFNEKEINQFIDQIKEQKKIPDKAVDMVFGFYKKNRYSVGGLTNSSCIDKPEYRIRFHDKGLKKSMLKEGIKNESCLCVMDYTKGKYEERGHCIFLEKGKKPTIDSFLVAHGRGSGEKEGIPQKFTNKVTPTGTTLSGLFITAPKVFQFYGNVEKYGKYTSRGLALYGVEEDNWTAARVGKVSHGAPYVKVTEDKKTKKQITEVGHSLGCPAMNFDQAKQMLPKCEGQAAWLNYTLESEKSSTKVDPAFCKVSVQKKI